MNAMGLFKRGIKGADAHIIYGMDHAGHLVAYMLGEVLTNMKVALTCQLIWYYSGLILSIEGRRLHGTMVIPPLGGVSSPHERCDVRLSSSFRSVGSETTAAPLQNIKIAP